MTADRSTEYLAGLVRELCKVAHETEWLEFKGYLPFWAAGGMEGGLQ